MKTIDRLNQAIHYIEENLCGDINYNEISKITLSPISAFQKFFCLTTGMALSEYIRRRRLSCAANDLLNTNKKISDIAVKYGYESADAFSVAFKRTYNISPSFARQNHVNLKPFHRLYYELSIKYIKGDTKMKRIANNRELCDGMKGHNYGLPDCIKFILECVRINKSYQRINRKDVITTPKNFKSNRVIKMPDFLSQEIQEYLKTLYGYSKLK